MVIRRVGIWSVGRIYGAICAAMGLLIGLCVAAFSAVGAGIAGANSDMPAGIGAIFGVGAILFLPVFYGILGVVGGAIGAALYNLFAGMVGGVEIEVHEAG